MSRFLFHLYVNICIMPDVNKYDLSRTIDADIRRQIRQACGFGCCVCGNAITEYEHVDPPFEEAKIHDPQHITLLCTGCHGKVTRKFWSKDKIKKAMQNPACLAQGYSNEVFDFGLDSPWLQLGGVTIQH